MISLPPLYRLDDPHFYVSGNVTIHPSVAIAAGAVLQADPDSQLVLAEGVCVGAGTVLHACGGSLELEAGVSLGSGVLMVGSAKIGARACIGSMSTVLGCSIEAEQVVPPGSLLGDCSRQVVEPLVEEPLAAEDATPTPDAAPAAADQNGFSASKKPPVYGLDAFNELRTMLFPHRQTLNGSAADPSLVSGEGDRIQQ